MHDRKQAVRSTALLATALHIAKHFCSDNSIKAEFERMQQICLESLEKTDPWVTPEQTEVYLHLLQVEDEGLRHFLREGSDCGGLEELFLMREAVDWFSRMADPSPRVFFVNADGIAELH